MALADLWKGSRWALRGYYSSIGGGYDIYYSRANPYFENYNRNEPNWAAVPWERFVRNPLAINNVEVYGAKLDFYLGSVPFEIAYYGLQDNNDLTWARSPWHSVLSGDPSEVPVQTLLSFRTSTEVAEGVRVGLTAGYQSFNDNWRPDVSDQKMIAGDVTVAF